MNLSRAAEKNFACSSPQNAQITEAYGIKVLEYTERIDAARHTTEGRIDSLCSVAEVKYGCRLWRRKALVLVSPLLVRRPASIHFCGFLHREA